MAGPTPHILVCDDEPTLCAVFRAALEDEGYRVTAWTAPCDDLREVVAVAPDLIILDLVFGRRHQGTEFLHHLKTQPLTAALPVLICTASERSTEAPHDDGTCATLGKPFDVDELLGAVCQCLRGTKIPD